MPALIRRLFLGFFFTAALPLFCSPASMRQVEALLQISDFSGAVDAAYALLKNEGQTPEVKRLLVKALAHDGQEKEMLRLLAENSDDQALAECAAWGVLWKASTSPTLTCRIYSLIAAALTQDFKGVPMIRQALHDSSCTIRKVACQLSGLLRDGVLCLDLLDIMKSDRSYEVRLQAIRAAGVLRLKAAKGLLLGILENERSTVEEKQAAAEALARIVEDCSIQELEKLAASNRAGLRLLACQLCAFMEKKGSGAVLERLSQDDRPQVRTAAFYSLGLLGLQQEHMACLKKGMNDALFEVAHAAAWCLLQENDVAARDYIAERLTHPVEDVRLTAAATLASAGSAVSTSLLQQFEKAQDLFVRVNLGLGLVKERLASQQVCCAIKELLQQQLLIQWKETGLFTWIAPSDLRRNGWLLQMPETEDAKARLKLLHVLALLQDPSAMTYLRHFLIHRAWGLSAMAFSLLWEEGDPCDVDLLHQLLDDERESPQVRLQAALVMAHVAPHPKAIHTLCTTYSQVDNETKLRILEALGSLAGASAVPFLIERMQEPFQSLRLVAASSLIRCLNH